MKKFATLWIIVELCLIPTAVSAQMPTKPTQPGYTPSDFRQDTEFHFDRNESTFIPVKQTICKTVYVPTTPGQFELRTVCN